MDWGSSSSWLPIRLRYFKEVRAPISAGTLQGQGQGAYKAAETVTR